MDQSHNEIMAEWLHAMGRAIEGFLGPTAAGRRLMRPELLAYRRAFERFTGSPDRVQQGDFQRALDLLQCTVDDDPCSLDHHGNCQTHGWPHETECYMSRTRRFLARLQPEPEDSP